MSNLLNLARPLLAGMLPLLIGACVGTTEVEIEGGALPVPLLERTPVNLGIYLDEELTTYVYREEIENKGTWVVPLGPIQRPMFENIGVGLFESYRFVDAAVQPASTPASTALDGILKPAIKEVQFSLPSQTRTNYYEVWVRYTFTLLDRAGNPVGEWNLPAYGKASDENYGSAGQGLQAAALAACRDAMAFFSINFAREPSVRRWIAAGKPLMPAPPAKTTPEPGVGPADNPSDEQSTNEESAGEQA